jgi:hypothetical protein
VHLDHGLVNIHVLEGGGYPLKVSFLVSFNYVVEKGRIKIFRVEMLVQLNYFNGVLWWKDVEETFASIARLIYTGSEEVFCVEHTPFIALD